MKSMETWWSESHGMYMHLFIHFPQLPGPGRWFFTYSYLYHPGTWGSERSIRPPRFLSLKRQWGWEAVCFFLTDILLDFFSRKILQPESFLWGESSLESIKEILPRFIFFPKDFAKVKHCFGSHEANVFRRVDKHFSPERSSNSISPGFLWEILNPNHRRVIITDAFKFAAGKMVPVAEVPPLRGFRIGWR